MMYLYPLSPATSGHRRQNGTAGANRRPPSPRRICRQADIRREPEGIMPCHARSASPPRNRRIPSVSRLSRLLPLPVKPVATLDFTSETAEKIRTIILRFHTGRWPLFRCHDLRGVDTVIYELAEWRPYRTNGREPKFSIVTWTLTEIGLSWHDYPSLAAAREAFTELVSADTPVGPAAPAAASTRQ